MWIERDERDLRHRTRHYFRTDFGVLAFPLTDFPGTPPHDRGIHLLHANLHRLRGGLLQAAIERRVDAHATGTQIAVFVAGEESVTHQIDIVWSVVRLHVR